MRREDVERMLNNAAKDLVPDVLQRVKDADVAVIPVTEEIRPQRNFALRRIILTLSLVFILLISGGSVIGLSTAEAERVYIDVNPSVEFVLNYFNRVKQVNYYNEDAEQLFADYKVVGKDIEEVIDVFIEKAEEQGYFEGEDAAMYISVACKNNNRAEKKAAKYNAYATNTVAQNNICVNVVQQNVSGISKETAIELNITVGKLKLIQSIIEADSSYTISGLRSKTMSELNAILRQINNSSNSNANDNSGNNSANDNSGNNTTNNTQTPADAVDNSSDNGNGEGNDIEDATSGGGSSNSGGTNSGGQGGN